MQAALKSARGVGRLILSVSDIKQSTIELSQLTAWLAQCTSTPMPVQSQAAAIIELILGNDSKKEPPKESSPDPGVCTRVDMPQRLFPDLIPRSIAEALHQCHQR